MPLRKCTMVHNNEERSRRGLTRKEAPGANPGKTGEKVTGPGGPERL